MTAAATLPLADVADRRLRDLSAAMGVALPAGATLLGERAASNGFAVPGRTSAGGGCRLYDARDGVVALNLARPDDVEMLPALFEADRVDDVTRLIAGRSAASLVDRGRAMGLAIARDGEPPVAAVERSAEGASAPAPRRAPRVLDLAALWAGPLAAHLLGRAGGDVVKVEDRRRPDALRGGDPAHFARLNGGKASVAIDPRSHDGRRALTALIDRADIVIEAARPRALRQLGIDADAIVAARPGLVWTTITGHGARGPAADWVGFGDDCGVAGGLVDASRAAGVPPGFVGDAIADPLTGILAAAAAWAAWRDGRGGRIGVAMRGVVRDAIAAAGPSLAPALRRWRAAEGSAFPVVPVRRAGAVAPFGSDTDRLLGAVLPC